MEEHSFSLQFNPLQRIKTVKDYEREIEELRNENFEIKHQLAHGRAGGPEGIQEDIQQLLVDSKRSIDILEAENAELSRQVCGMKETVKRMEAERGEADAGRRVQECLNKISLLEEENGRLLQHLSGVNGANAKLREENGMLSECFNRSKSAIDEQKGILEKMGHEKEERMRAEQEVVSYRNALANSNKERDQAVYERDRERSEYSSRIGQLQGAIASLEEKVNSKDAEMGRLREYYGKMEKEYSEMCRQGQSGELYMKEMRENYMRETREKQSLALRNEELVREVEGLRARHGELLKRIEVCENEKRALSYKVSQDRAGDLEMNKVKEELREVRKDRDRLAEEADRQRRSCAGHMEDLERSKDLEMFLKDLLQEKGKECDRRLLEVERLGHEVEGKIDSARRMLGDLGMKGRGEEELDKMRQEIRELRRRESGYRRMVDIGEEGKRFLRSLGMDPLGPVDEIVRRFRSLYRELARKVRVLDKEANEAVGFAESNKDVMHERTVRVLQDFSREFDVARKDLEACKRYLEKKGKENKELKASNLDLERRFNECRRNEERIRSLYSVMADKLRRKDEAISRLEMKIGPRP